MFEKLLSVLPYNPGLLHQIGFYGQRMREEAAIRRTGMIFIVLTFLVQFFAVLSPPVSTVAASNNDLINGGFMANGQASASEAKTDCNNNVQDYKVILEYYGISCDAVGNATATTINSHDHNSGIYSMGRLPYDIAGEQPVNITWPDGTALGKFYVRQLAGFDTGTNKTTGSSYPALQLKNSAGVTFWLEGPCGNLATVGVPQPVTPPRPTGISIPNEPTPAPAPAPTKQPPPVLGVNPPTCTEQITGWASENQSNSTEVIKVDVYVDGPVAINHGGTYLGEVNNGGHGYPSTNPSWTVPIPTAYQNSAHTFYVYAINTDGTYSGPGISGSGNVYGSDPITVTPCAKPTPAPTPTPIPTPTPPPATCPEDSAISITDSACVPCQYNNSILASNSACVPPPSPCQYDSAISSSDNLCVPCQYNNSIIASSSSCKSCEASLSSQDTLACVQVSKKAANLTQSVADANNTTAQPGDVIQYTLYAQNNGKGTVKQFVFQENLSDVLDYATVSDLHGGTIDSNGLVTWPAVDIAPGTTASVLVAVTVKNPVPQTPADPGDPNHFDLIMTNVYGNTINIHVPGSPAKSVQMTAAALPNTGPGTSLFVAAAVVMVAGYFWGRARLLARESELAVQENSGA